MASENPLPQVELYTDGACLKNPGPGGWGYVLRHPASGREKQCSGGEHDTTNNRMEILAVIRGLEALRSRSVVKLLSDSQYVVNAIKGWISKWRKRGYRNVKNADLWRRLEQLLGEHDVEAHWIRGHSGHRYNERCDRLAEDQAALMARTPRPAADRETPTASSPGPAGLFGGPSDRRGSQV